MVSYILPTSELVVIGVFGVVRFGAVSIEFEESKHDHLATDKNGGDAVIDVVIGEARRGVHGPGGAEDGEDNLVGCGGISGN